MDQETVEINSFSISGFIAMFIMALCLIIAAILMMEVAWQHWRSIASAEFEPADNDPRSQREAYLANKVRSLAVSIIDGQDIKITVQVASGDKNVVAEDAEVKTVLILVNRPERNVVIDEALSSLVTAGLGINTAQGDQLSVQFHAFASVNNSTNTILGLSGIQRIYLALGLLLFGSAGFGWTYHRHQQLYARAQHLENEYGDQLLRFKAIAEEEPARVASVLSDWLNGTPS